MSALRLSPARSPGLLVIGLAATGLMAGCTADPARGGGALPVVSGDDFFDRPFPADTRLEDGHPDFDGFPHQGEYGLLDAYLASSVDLDGFGTNSPIYLRFEEPIDPSTLPTPEGSLEPDATVRLVDVTPGSPTRGEAVPIAFEWTETATAWKPDHLLAIAPVFGFPLRPKTTYAVLLRSPLAAPGARESLWYDPALASTVETLDGLGEDPEATSYAWTFTTQDTTAEMARIARTIHEDLAPPALDQELEVYAARSDYTAYVGTVLLPIWQAGERPYREEGGGFTFDDTGAPVITRWERVHFALSIPKGDAPEGGWPTVLYSHGTGGDYTTFCNSGDATEEASVLADRGIAVVGVSQPLHADRGTPDTNVELDSFNFYNPEAGRTNFRQGALDQVYLATLLTRRAATFTHEGETIRLDPDAVAFFGHSQGGLVGAIGAPFFSDQLRAAAFSGTGGGLSLTIVLRKDPLDIALLLSALLEFDEGEELTPFHPVTGLIQTLIEVSDPLNYAPAYFAERPDWPAAPLPMLLTEGMEDPYTPGVATEALAAAARIPIVGDAASDPLGLRLRGLSPQDLPTSGNAVDWSGEPITAGLGQFPGQGHYAIYDEREARKLYRDFLDSTLNAGAPALGGS